MARKKDYLEHLTRVPMFSACSKKDLDLISRQADEVRLDPGYVLMAEGDVGQEFFVLLDGKADITRRGKKLETIGAGAYVGELALLDKAPRNATVTAKTPVTALVLGQREFNGVLAQVPAISHKIMVGMARRLHQLDAKA
ncbi:MAG TPA: cyclic nucleotide-binding domain-containing protein [Acidimicrobiales bacterium]|jgi:CRP-like cAMP-binding protein|nr:cyclic nucleotide-binding domain-containing protein [Acidimicrobiales bacterium]